MSEIGLYIKDYAVKGHPVRKYGTDRHDSLIISKDGKTLSYYNLQNGDGSKYGDYRFCDADGLIPEEDEDLQIHGALAYANIGGFGEKTLRAKWIQSEICAAKTCSNCNNAHMGLSNFKYCPQCGARMDKK